MVLTFFISFICNRFNKVMVLKDGTMLAFDIHENLRNRNETRILVAGQGQRAIEAWMKKLGSIRKKRALFKLSKRVKHSYLIFINS